MTKYREILRLHSLVQPKGHCRKLQCFQEDREQGAEGSQREEHLLAAERH